MKFNPLPYQRHIIAHEVQNPRCAVWAGMGMGKTSGTLAAINVIDLIEPCFPVLVLAPLRVAKSVWPAEVAKWDELQHLKIQPIVGKASQRRRALTKKADIYTMNYENLPWLLEQVGDSWPFVTVVADESTRLKSFRLGGSEGKRAKALSKMAFRNIKRFITLTGTPSPNGLQDLWGQYWFLDKGAALGRTYTAFKNRWFQFLSRGTFVKMEPTRLAQPEIERRVAPITLSIRPEDWFPDLLKPIVRNVEVDMPPAARAMYKDMEKELYTEIEGHPLEAMTAAAKTIKCLQLASGAAYIDKNGAWKTVHNEKLLALESIVEEAAGMPVLVAYHFKSDLARLQKHFPQGQTLDKNPATLDKWNAGKIPVMFAHPGSAGHGLNLQDGGNLLVFFSHWWDLEQRQQIIERIGPVRQLQSGHKRAVFIYNLIGAPIDSTVIARHATKKSVQDALLDARKKVRNND